MGRQWQPRWDQTAWGQTADAWDVWDQTAAVAADAWDQTAAVAAVDPAVAVWGGPWRIWKPDGQT